MKLIPAFLCFLALCHSVPAVTLAVLPGGSIQEKVDLAQPGDIVAIFGGTYPGDVTVTKAIRLVEVDGEDVTITGNITWTGVTDAPPFEGFTVGSVGKGITIASTTGLVLKNIESISGFGVKVNGTSTASAVGSSFSNVEQDGGVLTISRSVVTGTFNTTINCLKTVSFRTVISSTAAWNSKRSWFGYSAAKKFDFSGVESSVTIVSARIDSGGAAWDAILLQGAANRFYIVNSIVKGVIHGDQSYAFSDIWGWYWHAEVYPGRGISIGGGNSAFVANNYIKMNSVGYRTDNSLGEAISCGQNSQIYNNIFSGAKFGVSAPYGADSRNNIHYNYVSGTETGGLVPVGTLTGDPLFIANDEPNLQPASPCLNSGVSDPVYNDLDGTRNDLGPVGGCLFDPEGWTTANPVVISFDIAPQQLLRGVDKQITLSNGQAVSQP